MYFSQVGSLFGVFFYPDALIYLEINQSINRSIDRSGFTLRPKARFPLPVNTASGNRAPVNSGR